jgi:fucose 4-O-acetylase-like acetyltransferase
MAEEMSRRLEWLDFAKGFGISMVIVYHTLEGIQNSFVTNQNDVINYINFFRIWLMPMFFLVSGVVASTGIRDDSFRKKRNKIKDWAYIYVVWSVIIYLVRLLSNNFTNTSMNIDEIFYILWNPVPTIWFIYALMLSYILASLFKSLNPQLIILIAVVVNILNASLEGWFPDSIFQRLAWVYCFYQIGVSYGKQIRLFLDKNSASYIFLLFFVLLSPVLAIYKDDISSVIMPFLSICLILGFLKMCNVVCLFASRSIVGIPVRFFSYVGVLSIFVYLTHFPFPALHEFFLIS